MCIDKLIIFFISVFCIIKFIDCKTDDDFKERLRQLPERFSQIGHALWPEGVPPWLLDIYAPTHAPPSLCKDESLLYEKSLNNFTSWALQMFDSSSKLPSGMMKAHFKDLGSFDECLEVDEIGPFPVQHCLLELRGFMKYPKLPVDLDKVETIVGGIPVLKPNLGLSLCLPSSCNRDQLLQHYDQVFSHLNLTPILDKYSCSNNEPEKYTALDWITICYINLILFLVVISSLIDISGSHFDNKTGLFWGVLRSFSAKRSSSTIMQWKDPRRPLAVLRGLRFLAIAWIVVAHNYVMVIVTPTLNWIYIYDLMESWGGAVFQNGKCAVDLFLLMSGMLLSYLFMDSMEAGRKFKLGMFYLHRLVRILPTYLTIVLLAMTFYPKYDNGPLWKTTIERHKDNCMEHWWTNVLFINNYFHTDRQCLPQAWYLAVDMQLHILSPLVLFPLYKWKSFAKIGIPLLVIASVVISFCVSYYNKIPAGAVIARDLTTVEAYSTEYITTHTRFGAYVIGIGLGYILHKCKNKNIIISKPTLILCWSVSLTLTLSMLFGIRYFINQDNVYNRFESALYTGLQSVLWSLGMAWVIFACETGYAVPVRKFLASKLFQPLGKITFAIYLVHGSFQYLLVAMMKTPRYLEFVPNWVEFSGIMTVTAFTSFVFCIVFELPFISLEDVFFGKDDEKEERKNDEKTQNSISNHNKVSLNSSNVTIF